MKHTKKRRGVLIPAASRVSRRGLSGPLRRRSQRVIDAVGFHWFTHFWFWHRRATALAVEPADALALRDIVLVQSHGDEQRALKLIEQIIAAPIEGDRLSTRYEAWWRFHDPAATRAQVRGAMEANAGRGA